MAENTAPQQNWDINHNPVSDKSGLKKMEHPDEFKILKAGQKRNEHTPLSQS